MTQGPPRVPPWLLIAMVLAGAAMFAPFWTWLVLAVWVGQLGRRMVPPLTRLTGRSQRAAAVLTAALIALLVVPIGLIVGTLIGDAIVLARRLVASPEVRQVFEKLVTRGATDGDSNDPFKLLVEHGDRAWNLVSVVFTVATKMLLGLFVFLSATYAVLADGPRGYRWFEDYLPLDPRITRRFAAAFTETGRGLFIGVGGAGLAQAAVATVAYVVLDVPEPLVLGLLTLVASVVPSVGTAMVWVPVAAGLWLTGRPDAAIGMAVVGVAVIGSIDNVVRPVLARRGQLDLPSVVIMISMFGGLALVGASGVVLGPLVVRLAKEAMAIAREARIADAAPHAPGHHRRPPGNGRH
ncbi:MAG: AI-2E family transporter [Myxococcales bacterium]|nr:AI-2E family transporter [Myxococcales bacterium]